MKKYTENTKRFEELPVDVQAASATPRLANSLGDNGFFNR